jgi:hypothetical protein
MFSNCAARVLLGQKCFYEPNIDVHLCGDADSFNRFTQALRLKSIGACDD